MKTQRTCPQCGLVFASAKLDGLCPACLLNGLFNDDDTGNTKAFWDEDTPEAVADLAATTAPVRRFSHFELLEELGRGGMGIVYRARDLGTARIVAIKVLQAHHLEVPDLVLRFRSEVRAVTSLDHPHVLPVHEVGEYEGIPFFSMKLTTGGSLAHRVGDFLGNPTEIARLMAKVAKGVQHAHERGILHRDLKPGNILLDATGEPYVCDFGLAKWLEDDRNLTITSAVLGTPHYIAPEQASGQKGLTTAADIYSLGAIIYELLTARPPFIGQSIIETLRLASENTPERPSSLVQNIPHDLETICLKCLEREPSARYTSAAALAADLENWLDGRPILARPVSAGEQLWRWAKRNPFPASLVASVIFLVALAAVVATVSAVRIDKARDRAISAEKEKEEQLYSALLAQAKAARLTGRAGQRYDALAALAQAAKIHPSLEVKNEAIAALALADFKVDKTWKIGTSNRPPRGFDRSLTHIADEIEPGIIRVLRLSDSTEIVRLSEPNSTKIEFITHSGADLLAVRHAGGLIKVWSIVSGKKLFELTGRPTGAKAYWYAHDCCFNADATILAVGNPKGGATLHDAKTGRELLRIDSPVVASCLAFSPDSRQLALGSIGPVRAITWDLDSNKLLKSLDVPGPAYHIAWSPDGRTLAVGSFDVNIYVYELTGGRRLGFCKGHRQEVTQVLFNREGNRLISVSRDSSIRLWSLNALTISGASAEDGTFSQEVLLEGFGSDPGMRLSPDGQQLGIISANTAHLLTIGGAAPICRTMVNGKPPGRATLVGSVAFSPDGHLVATACYETIDLWDVRAGRLHCSFDLDPDIEKSVRFGKDSSTFIVGSCKSGLREYRVPILPGLKEPELVRVLDTREDFIFTNCPPGDRRLIPLTSRKLGIARIADLETGNEIFKVENVSNVWDLALSPDERFAVLGFSGLADINKGNFQIWSVAENKLVKTLPGKGPPARFSPDGRLMVARISDETHLWVTDSWKAVEELRYTGTNYFFSPLSEWLASSTSESGKTKINLSAVNSGQPLFTLESPILDCSQFRFSASADGQLLAAHSSDNTLLLWDLQQIHRDLAALGMESSPAP